MAIFKFYNIQLLPIDKQSSEVGSEGYCKLFKSVADLVDQTRANKDRLSAIGVGLSGGLFFSPFHVELVEFKDLDVRDLIHGHFLKFDDVNELVDTNSGELEYKSSGNTSSKRFEFEFVFDPVCHIMAIHDVAGLPTNRPLMNALSKTLEGHARRLYPNHSLEVSELTEANSVEAFLHEPKQGITSYTGSISFSNSDDWDEEIGKELIPKAKEVEEELKSKRVGKWEAKFRAFKGSLMNDLPMNAKIQLVLATLYGNAEAAYTAEDGEKKKYHMDDHPVREKLTHHKGGMKNRILAIADLIKTAKRKTRVSSASLLENKGFISEYEDKE
ncbi:DUF4747 family protein [Salinivibrio proteolyticus]|uniref:DUF4747 family protein n=1 Tax=Salinivibrio proteolyticus TaxID=334715 RepID=A0ABY7L9D9_9GAMM|nr:DUF4747 family protein [Salinivibrio proteolyticus]WBA13866.1 DUF4747 family protein [Salinivibrio proteolyticus]